MGEKEVLLLRKFKEKTGWSYVRIAEEIGVHYQSIVAWFAGRKVPGNLASKAIREFLDKEVTDNPVDDGIVRKEAADSSEAGAGIAAIETTLDDLPDDRPESGVFE